MRHLKYHEQKLMKKVNLYDWQDERSQSEATIINRFQLKDRTEYIKYKKLVIGTQKFVNQLKDLPTNDPVRIELTQKLLEKLYHMGLIPERDTSLLDIKERLTVAMLCSRRLPTLMVKLKMAQKMADAVKFIKDGHVTIGPKIITDPALLVTRNFEDHITWAPHSKIRKNIAEFNNKKDDYDFTR